MTKTESLNSLFDAWQKRQKLLDPCGMQIRFIPDGIVDEPVFEKESKKVLFISNEANTKYESHDSCTSDRRKDFLEFHGTGHDSWRGKMRLRMCELYKVIAQCPDMPAKEAALHFAMMNLNKAGGTSSTNIERMRWYCSQFREEILEEISIIAPDVIAWCGQKTFFLASEYLGAEGDKEGKYVLPMGEKKIPLLSIWHTSYFQGRINPADGYTDKTLGKQVAKLLLELNKHGL